MNYTVKEMPCENNGKRLHVLVYRPSNTDGKLPVIIMSHGYNSSHADLADMAECAAGNGFAVCCFDFCGGSVRSKSDGSSLDMSVMTEMSDLAAVISMIRELDFADKERIFLYGESQGGFISALAASEEGNNIPAVAMLFPAFCIPDDWKEDRFGDSDETVCMGMSLSRKFSDEIPSDVWERLSSYSGKALIFHGTADGLVKIDYARKAQKCYKAAELVEYEGEGHGFSPPARKDAAARMMEFFKNIS